MKPRQICFSLIGLSAMMCPTLSLEVPEALTSTFQYDRGAPLDVQASLFFEQDALTVKQVTYLSPRGGRVPALLVEPKGEGPFAAVLFGHWGYGNKTEFLAEALCFGRAGAVSLLIDYPWVRPPIWRKTVNNYTKPKLDYAAYVQAVVDFRRGIDLLTSLPSVDVKRIGFVGHSYGAQFGAILSAVDKRIQAYVLMAGIPDAVSLFLESQDPDFVEFRKTISKQVLDSYLKTIGVFDAIRYIPYAAPAQVFFQFARLETRFDKKVMLRYATAAPPTKIVKWYPTGHELSDPQAFADRADWLGRHLNLKFKTKDFVP
jgi:pimeloyl-ACP methyl ester carboxylesterase